MRVDASYEMGYLLTRSRYSERNDDKKLVVVPPSSGRKGYQYYRDFEQKTLVKVASIAGKVSTFVGIGVAGMVAAQVIREKSEDVQTYSQFASDRTEAEKTGIPNKLKSAYSHMGKDLALSVYAAEKRIMNNKKESLFVFDKDGKPLMIRGGTEISVSLGLTDAFNKKSRAEGVVLTHNHPNGAPFSYTDLMIGYFFPNTKEVRATTDKYIYSIQSSSKDGFGRDSTLAKKHKDATIEESIKAVKQASTRFRIFPATKDQIDDEANKRLFNGLHVSLTKSSKGADYTYRRFNR